MKVKELIEELQKCDQEKEVWRSNFDGVEEWDTPVSVKETDYNVYIE